MPPGRFRPARADWIQAGLVAAALFGLYALSSPRTVAMEDDSLFVLSSYFLGIEHPPGYPLFTLIGHLFAQLPFGPVAYRVHLASAFFGALSGGAAWLCARALVAGRLPAYLAAFGLGVSPVFWSQAIIAEVYTLNTFFLLVLLLLALRVCPPSAEAPADSSGARALPWMALLFGLSLSNHYPLMLLVAPGFAVLLWPAREELLKRAGVLVSLVAVGLLPYLWLVRRSWLGLPINFEGPLETLPEIWFFLSRAGYADIDQSTSANWFDRIKFFQFIGGQLLVQFAVAGTLLAAAGFAVQWRQYGRRVGAALAIAFLMPSAGLIVLLGFDYSSVMKHIFHVYPLPAYAIASLWMAVGADWLILRYALRRSTALAGGAAVLALILAAGARTNVLADHEWGARYAQTILRALPRDAMVFARGDPDLAPMAYFHMIENWRPDITLYQSQGLILGNRLFHPLRTNEEDAKRAVRELIERQTVPVVFTLEIPKDFAWRDRWLYSEIDKSLGEAGKSTVEIPEEALRFFEESIASGSHANGWVAFFQGELRYRYAMLLARTLPRGEPPAPRVKRHIDLLSNDFFGALGIAEGLLANEKGFSAGAVGGYLDRARELMPSDVAKEHLARFFVLRGALRASAMNDATGAIGDFETALSVWPSPSSSAILPLEDIHRKAGNEQALKALRERVAQFKRRKP